MSCQPPPRRLVVFSGCAHHLRNGQVVAHGGFVREMEVWARIFPNVLVVTVQEADEGPADAICYSAPGIACAMLRPAARTTGLIGKVRLAALALQWIARALPLLKSDDIVMARGPDSLGFLGGVLARMKGLARFAKYADQWQAFPGEPRGYRWQKAFYRGVGFRAPVQIYGSADPGLPRLVPFFTSSLTQDEWLQAGRVLAQRKSPTPWRILFCGRFVPAKGIDLLLYAFKKLVDSGVPAELDLVGDGEEKSKLVRLSQTLGIQERTVFHGWLGRDALLEKYGSAHIFVSASRKEGFGKVIIEAMAYALPVVATDVGVSRFLVNPPECGAIAKPESQHDLAEQLLSLIGRPEVAQKMGLAARMRARQFVFENLERQYREFLVDHCGVVLN